MSSIDLVVLAGIVTELEALSERVNNITWKPDAIRRLIVTWESPGRRLKQVRCDNELEASNYSEANKSWP